MKEIIVGSRVKGEITPKTSYPITRHSPNINHITCKSNQF